MQHCQQIVTEAVIETSTSKTDIQNEATIQTEAKTQNEAYSKETEATVQTKAKTQVEAVSNEDEANNINDNATQANIPSKTDSQETNFGKENETEQVSVSHWEQSVKPAIIS